MFSLNKWTSVMRVLAWFSLGMLCHNVFGNAWRTAFQDDESRLDEKENNGADPVTQSRP
jgi:hypothetical protein